MSIKFSELSIIAFGSAIGQMLGGFLWQALTKHNWDRAAHDAWTTGTAILIFLLLGYVLKGWEQKKLPWQGELP